MISLVLEASTYEGSTALMRDGTLIGDRVVAMRGREHEALMAAVGSLLEESGVRAADLDRVVCGAGPGSFTSLRIAGSIAKGLALASGATLVPISSLTLLAASWRGTGPVRVLSALDAMRGEHYVQLHSVDGQGVIVPEGDIQLVPTPDLAAFGHSVDALVIGPAQHEDARVTPRAAGAARITNLIDASSPANLADWEPGYGRLAEAQVKWEATHGRPLPA